ncbi:MAG: ATP-dependent DNA ligase [Candidatus Pacearchaeota archaeon]
MKYSEICEVYEHLSKTSGRLEKIFILGEFLRKLRKDDDEKWIYLLRGKVLPDYDAREFGISRQLVIKIIAKSSGIEPKKVVSEFNKIGDLGEVAEKLLKSSKQKTLYRSGLSISKVFNNLYKIFEMEGKGSVEKKINLVSEILMQSNSSEAKWIIRTLLGDLRIGVADNTLRDALAEAFIEENEDKKELAEKIEKVYDLSNDFAEVFKALKKGIKELDKVSLVPGKAINVMLPIKVTNIKEAFRICGIPCAIEHKYDGFRVVITKKDNEIKLFTRRLEEVTNQFPDLVELVKKYIKGKNFILDSEVVGFDPKTGKYKPFEAISQRIKRKYDIEELRKKLPVEANVFDVLYYEDESLVSKPFKERRKILEKIIPNEKWKIKPSFQIITDSEKLAMQFYKEALKIGEEGIMIKNLNATYKPGRYIGYIVKMKPEKHDFDLVITSAEYGTGKRAGWLTSYIVACHHEGKYLDVGKVSSGLKEKESEEGTTYHEMTNLLKPLILSEKGQRVKVKPKIVVSVTYQNIQKSPTYSSGYAMRFPRITHYRPDRRTHDIATLEDIKREARHSFGGD